MLKLRVVSRKAIQTAIDSVKVSDSGSSEALFLECIAKIRSARIERDPDVHTSRSEVIDKLTQEETDITRRLFERLDEDAMTTEQRIARRDHNIDPYWDPFHKVAETHEKVQAEFDEYAKLVSVGEAKEIRSQIRKALVKNRARYDSYSLDYRRWLRRLPASKIPIPHKVHESFWDLSGLQKQLSREKITWRDPDVIQHFRAVNGYILPRRLTKLTKRKQYDLVKAVRVAQQMAIIPFDWNSRGSETMPLMDPVEWMSYRLSRKVEKDEEGKVCKNEVKDLRATAMMTVLMEALEGSKPTLLDGNTIVSVDEGNTVSSSEGDKESQYPQAGYVSPVRMNYFKHILKARYEKSAVGSSVGKDNAVRPKSLPFEERLRAVLDRPWSSSADVAECAVNPSRDPPVFHG